MATAEPDFGYHFGQDGTNTWSGWIWTAGSESSPLQPGDVVIMQLLCAVDPLGGSVADIHPVDPVTGAALIDWVADVNENWVDPTTGMNYAHGVWHKVWTGGDNPSTYSVLFTGYPVANTGFSEVNVNIYAVLGAGGSVTFNGVNDDSSYNAPIDPTHYSQNFGDGHSWNIDLPEGFHTAWTFGYYPRLSWYYYTFPGVGIYGAGLFGYNNFFGAGFLPSFDQESSASGADNDPAVAHTLILWDVLAAGDIHIGGDHAHVHVSR